MQPYNEYIKLIPKEVRAKHSALLVDAAILLDQCADNPHAYRDLDPSHFQILDLCELGPSLEEFRGYELEELEAIFKTDLEYLGAEFVSKDGDEYWRFDVADPYKQFWLKQVLSDIMNQTLYPH